MGLYCLTQRYCEPAAHGVHDHWSGPSRAPACALCPVEGGLLKRTTCNRWVHSACTLWVPETAVDMDRGLVDGLQYIPKVCTLVDSLFHQKGCACIFCHTSHEVAASLWAQLHAVILSCPMPGLCLAFLRWFLKARLCCSVNTWLRSSCSLFRSRRLSSMCR